MWLNPSVVTADAKLWQKCAALFREFEETGPINRVEIELTSFVKSPPAPPCQRGVVPPFGKGRLGGISVECPDNYETLNNARLGYRRPGDIINGTAGFCRKAAAPRIQKAFPYLRLTREGSDWIANLQSNMGERIT